ncbi:MAG: hypothetical protein CM1200mP5_4920 [Candidatus Pelagibacterales bacterium]|nr:MAG: hypothetical protein CM1200mP5_4920 [Pelagibacterales bacterium]
MLNPGKVYPILRKWQRKEGFMSTEEKKNFQTFQDSNNVYKPLDEREASNFIKEVYRKIYQ